jgi:hypothetical protein
LFTLPKVIRQIASSLFLVLPRNSPRYIVVRNSILVCPSGFNCLNVRILPYSSSWIAWFPVLFYSTLYVGDLYKSSIPAATSEEEQTVIDDEATRLGSRALFYFSLLSLIVSVVLPAFVAEAAGHPPQKPEFVLVETGLSCAERNASALGNDVGCKSVVICGLYVCNSVCYIFDSITLYNLLDASFTVSLTAYGGPLSSSLLRAFRGLLLNGLHSPWLVIVTVWLILRLNLFSLARRSYSN